MARLIDADAVLLHKRKMCGADFGGEFWDEAVLASDIKNAPTIDAVPVVRCKDCKYFKTRLCENEDNHDDWFCADGERKGGDDNG